MFSEQGITILTQGLERLDILFDDRQITNLVNYWSIVEEVNRTMNLTRITGDRAITHHILDAAAVIPVIDGMFPDTDALRVVDIGTGCGVPGIVLKILKPSWEILLVDSLQKRVRFLQRVIDDLALGQMITAIHARAEDIALNKQYANKFDVAISRAVSSLGTVLEYSKPFLKPAGAVVAMKGPKVMEELEELQKTDRKAAQRIQLKELTVPFMDDEQRYIAYVRRRESQI